MNRSNRAAPITKILHLCGLVLAGLLDAATAAAAEAPPKKQPLDVREPPFADYDLSWLNGSNRQPASLLVLGPVTWSLYVDGYYAWQFREPVDHTIFPTTTAPRHNELSLNLVALGADVTGLDGPIGRLYLQYGANVATDAGQDTTVSRGFYLRNHVFDYIQQAAVGWHFHWFHGFNLEIGIFPSYFALESYLPQENWNYLHPFISDFTPYYFAGIRSQLFPTRHLKLELWVVNGWQTFGQWHETRAGGHQITWRPREWLSLGNSAYIGREVQNDPDSLRIYLDNYAQVRYYHGNGRRLSSAAFCVTADIGYEHRGNADSGVMAGVSLAHRLEWRAKWALTLRGDLFYDRTQALILQLPIGSPYSLPNKSAFLGGGLTATIDFLPSPWLLVRFEYMHREANVPYYSGSRGITGPRGVAPTDPALFTPDLRKSDDRLVVNATLRL